MPRLPFETLQQLDLPLAELVSGRLGFVHDAFLPFPYEVTETLPEEAGDLVVILGKRRRSDGIREIAEHPGRAVVLFAPNDAPIRSAYMGGRPDLPPNVVAAYAVNNKLPDPRAVAVPLGVRINKLRPLQFVRQNHRGGREGLLYGNFAINDDYNNPAKDGAPHIRARLVEQLREEPWVTLEVGNAHREDPLDLMRYYSQMAGHKFVLSPEGNGIDCYRHWEALYLGAIPIVMASPVMSPFGELPVLFTEDYSELSEAYLARRWEEMSSRSFEIDRMLKSWYTRHFLQSVAALEDPRFVCLVADGSPSESFLRSLRRSSRSASGVLAETPIAPFTHEHELTEPKAWSMPGGLRLERVDGGLRAVAEGNGRAVAELALQTMVGAPLRLTGSVRAETGATSALTFTVEQRPEVIATAEAGDGRGSELELGFVARSERTVLTISALGAAPGSRWFLGGLSLHADV